MKLIYLLILLTSLSAAAQQNAAASYCNTRSSAADGTLAWRVNQSALIGAFNSWDSSQNSHLTSANTHLYIDRIIQNIARSSRARFRHRVIPYDSGCSAVDWSDYEPCITAQGSDV
jgi:hypothetical protein